MATRPKQTGKLGDYLKNLGAQIQIEHLQKDTDKFNEDLSRWLDNLPGLAEEAVKNGQNSVFKCFVYHDNPNLSFPRSDPRCSGGNYDAYIAVSQEGSAIRNLEKYCAENGLILRRNSFFERGCYLLRVEISW